MGSKKYRYLLSFDEASAILKRLGQEAREIYSETYYYDTINNANIGQGLVCSIRRCENKNRAHIKFRDIYGNERYVVHPFEVEDIPEQTTLFGELMYRQGCMITNRNVIYDCVGVKVSIDENAYLGVQDHELVIEIHGQKANVADMILYKLADSLKKEGIIKTSAEYIGQPDTAQNKSVRFFDRLTLNRETVGNDILSRYWLMN